MVEGERTRVGRRDGEAGRALSARVSQRLIADVLERGHTSAFTVRGNSMMPTLRDGERVILAKLGERGARRGDIIAFRQGEHLCLHRVLTVVDGESAPGDRGYLTAGDGNLRADGVQRGRDVIGRVVRVSGERGDWDPGTGIHRVRSSLRTFVALHPAVRGRLRAGRATLRRLASWGTPRHERAGVDG